MLHRSGVLCYEITIDKLGSYPQIGFAVEGFPCVGGNGVGDDSKSWGVDGGPRKSKWHNCGEEPWPCTWAEGDVVGLSANIDAGMIAVSKNGDWIDDGGGVVFEHEAIRAGVFPCFSASNSEFRCATTDFQHGAAAEDFWKRFFCTAITIPPGTTPIPPKAYANYASITFVELPVTVMTIGKMAFARCNSLNVGIPEHVVEIGVDAFKGCRLDPGCQERYDRIQEEWRKVNICHSLSPSSLLSTLAFPSFRLSSPFFIFLYLYPFLPI
jgi:hypothetical protein